jgi:hypothetical protein
VLGYVTPFSLDAVADIVFGQGGSFTSAVCNLGGVSAGNLCAPVGVGVDDAGSLYVADQGNHRVLAFTAPLSTDATADGVFGQGGSFTSNTPNLGGASATSLNGPIAVAVDDGGNLYVADGSNNRVLEYGAAPPGVPASATKLVVVDKGIAGAKAVFVAKDAVVTKGAGTDPAAIAVTLDFATAPIRRARGSSWRRPARPAGWSTRPRWRST